MRLLCCRSARVKKKEEERKKTGERGRGQERRTIRQPKVELIVGQEALSAFSPTPFFPPCPLPMHTHRYGFSYIFSTAYHVIVETYARERADMCSGPGSAGRQRDRRCAADILLILPLLFFPPPLFSVFVLLRFPLLLRRPFKMPLAAPYFSHFTPPRPAHFWPGI